MIPRGIGRLLGLIRAHRVVQPVAVEVHAVVARVGEHAVQHHAHALLLCLAAQQLEILVGAEGGVHLLVVARVVLVVGLRLKDGVQVQHRHAQFPQVGQLLDHAEQVAAEEVVLQIRAVGLIAVRIGQFIPVLVRGQPGLLVQQLPAAVAEAVHKDLIHHAVVHPLGRLILAVVHRDLEGRRLMRVLLPLAAQLLGVVAVPEGLLAHLDDEIVPQHLRLFGQRQRGFVQRAAAHVAAQRHGQLALALVRPQAQRAYTALGRGQAQPHAAAAGTRALRPAVALLLGIVLDCGHTAYLPPCSGTTRQILSTYS